MNEDCRETPTWPRLMTALGAFHAQGYQVDSFVTIVANADTDGREEVRISFSPGTSTPPTTTAAWSGPGATRAWKRAE